jgi:hypothetical protein
MLTCGLVRFKLQHPRGSVHRLEFARSPFRTTRSCHQRRRLSGYHAGRSDASQVEFIAVVHALHTGAVTDGVFVANLI